MKRLIILVTVLAAGALSIAAAGYQQPSQGLPAAALAATQIEKVKDNLYMITGADPTDRNSFSGGNTGVFITNTALWLSIRSWRDGVRSSSTRSRPSPTSR